jgi:hypothetical protein
MIVSLLSLWSARPNIGQPSPLATFLVDQSRMPIPSVGLKRLAASFRASSKMSFGIGFAPTKISKSPKAGCLEQTGAPPKRHAGSAWNSLVPALTAASFMGFTSANAASVDAWNLIRPMSLAANESGSLKTTSMPSMIFAGVISKSSRSQPAFTRSSWILTANRRDSKSSAITMTWARIPANGLAAAIKAACGTDRGYRSSSTDMMRDLNASFAADSFDCAELWSWLSRKSPATTKSPPVNSINSSLWRHVLQTAAPSPPRYIHSLRNFLAGGIASMATPASTTYPANVSQLYVRSSDKDLSQDGKGSLKDGDPDY